MERVWETGHPPDGRLPLHRHRRAYAAIVLEGGYDEVSPDGRFRCEPGMAVLHPPHHAHANLFGSGGARVLNVYPAEEIVRVDSYRVARLPDPATIERLVRREPRAGVGALVEELRPVGPRPPAGWVEEMAGSLRRACAEPLLVGRLATSVGVTPAHAARTFKRHFGVGPSAYRREFRIRLALRLLRSGWRPVEAAYGAGFADQSHFGRELKKMTGLTPGRWLAEQAVEIVAVEVKSVLDGRGRREDPLG